MNHKGTPISNKLNYKAFSEKKNWCFGYVVAYER